MCGLVLYKPAAGSLCDSYFAKTTFPGIFVSPQSFCEAVGVQLVLRGCRMHRRKILISAKHESQETLKGNQFNDFEFFSKKKKIIAVFSNDG